MLLLVPTVTATGAEAPLAAQAEFLQQHCVSCHGAEHAERGLRLDRFDGSLADAATFATLVRIHDRVEAGDMPPAGEQRPTTAAVQAFLAPLAQKLTEQEHASEAESGRTVLRRLNRTEYENSLIDLLGIPLDVRDILPPDTPAHGFDTVADGLRFSQLQVEKYLEAADVALDKAINLSERPERFHARMSLRDEKSIRQNLDTPDGTVTDPNSNEKHRVLFRELPDAVVMFSTGYPPGEFRKFNAPASGDYRIRASAYAFQTGGERATLRIFAHQWREKRLLGFFEMPETPREVELVVHLDRDDLLQVMPHGVGYDQDGRNIWNVGAPTFQGSGLAFQWLEVEGPLGDWPPASVRLLYPDVPIDEIPANQRRWSPRGTIGFQFAPPSAESSARQVIEQFARRAFRRPLEPDEAEPFVALAQQALTAGDTFEAATRYAFRAILTAPQFLFLEERNGPLDPYALASRLSYFLWSAPPDDELLALAADGTLTRSDVLRAQTERLIASPRSRQFIKNFGGQWLDLRNIKATSPDRNLYPEYDETLLISMVGESEAFLSELLGRDESIDNLIDSDFAMLNRAMARHYGIPGVQGEQFERVSLPEESPRGGVMTQAAILKVTANGTVTSPVVRGTWVMKRLLGQPPQPPPANVGAIEPDTRGATSIRELLDKHRNTEACATCHRVIDPPGFALESFDVIGGWRDRYRSLGTGDKPPWKIEGRDVWEFRLGPAVDASGQTADGRPFQGIAEFKTLMLSDRVQVARALTKNLLTYATGAGIRFSDRPEVERIVATTQSHGNGLQTLVHEVVQSDLFRRK